MKELTQENFYAAIQECLNTNGYTVLLVTEKMSDQKVIVTDWLRPVEHLIPHIKKASISSNDIFIAFENGNFIRGISLRSGQILGRRADLVLCEPWMMMDDDIRAELNRIEYSKRYFRLGEKYD